MPSYTIPQRIEPSQIVRRLRYQSSRQVSQVRARLLKESRRTLGFSLGFGAFGALLATSVAVAVNFWLGGALALCFGAAAGMSLRESGHSKALAHMLQFLDEQQAQVLAQLAQASDVVRELVRQYSAAGRTPCLVDLVYARSLVVRETRNGEKPSDLLPLEQTRRILAPV